MGAVIKSILMVLKNNSMVCLMAIFSMFISVEGFAKVRLEKKEFLVTLENTAPPFNDYNFFDSHKVSALKFNKKDYTRVNAFILSDFSALAYSSSDRVEKAVKDFGLKNTAFFSKNGVQAFVSSNKDLVIISFRGTEVAQQEEISYQEMLKDWLTDLKFSFSNNEYGAGKVHSGFYRSLNEIWNDLKQHLESIGIENKKVFLTGHSLGGALATLAADRLDREGANIDSIYTFGSPRVADIKFRRSLKVKHYRVVNNQDVVTKIPMNMYKFYEDEYYYEEDMPAVSKWAKHLGFRTFVHSGKLIFISSNGSIQHKMPKSSDEDSGETMKYILDHTPILYSIGIWNSMVEETK